LKWMKHDSNANADAKLKKLRLKYGMEGYGVYWLCLEYVAANVEKHNLTFELEHDAELIAADTGIHYELISEMMAYMVKLGLFENDRGVITCLKMATRTDEYTQKLLRSLENVPTISGQTPDNIPPNRIEENRIEKNREDLPPVHEIYNKICTNLPKVIKLTSARRSLIKARCKDRKHKTSDFWEWFFSIVRNEPWLNGKNERGWKADFDWLLKEKNFIKIIEASQ